MLNLIAENHAYEYFICFAYRLTGKDPHIIKTPIPESMKELIKESLAI